MNNRSGNTWAKLVLALGLMCVTFSFGAMAQDNPNEPLDGDTVGVLLEELAQGLPDLVGDEDKAAAITERWGAREDLEGKTRVQILTLLFADVQAIVQDPATRTKIWRAWNPPAPAATPASVQVSPVLDEQGYNHLYSELVEGIFLLGPSGSQASAIATMWTDRGSLAGKTRAQILTLLFADVQAVVGDPAIRTKIWKAWNAPPTQAAPDPIWNEASHPTPQAPTGYLTVFSSGSMKLPLLKWDVTIVDDQKRPIAGAKVSMKFKYGYAGASGAHILKINGRDIAEGIIQTATTNNTGTCSFSIPWTQNVNYDLSVSTAQGQPLKFKFDGKAPHDPPLPKDFNWEVKWKPSETIEVYSPEAMAKITKPDDDKKKVTAAKIAGLLAIPEDNWTRAAGWNESVPTAAVEGNDELPYGVNAELYNALSEHQQVRIGLTLLKLALSPNSFSALKKLNDRIQTLPRTTEPGTFTYWDYATKEDWQKFHAFEGQQLKRSVTIPFKSVPDPEDYAGCSKAAANGDRLPVECREILNAYTPYMARWERLIYTSCLDDPNLPPIADELTALAKSTSMMPGPLWDRVNLLDARDNICSMLVKNEMAKDMERDGFAVDLVNAGLRAGTMAARPPLRTVNIGGITEKVSDLDSLAKWYHDRLNRKVGSGDGSEKKLEGESDQAFQTRVLALLRDWVEPVSGRRFDDSMLAYRIERYSTPGPNTISVSPIYLGMGNRGRLIKNYLSISDLNEGKRDEGLFMGRVPPGKPMPDRRDVAIALYGWPVGVWAPVDMSLAKDQTEYLTFVMKRWVMFNLRTGEVYGTSKVDGNLFP